MESLHYVGANGRALLGFEAKLVAVRGDPGS
jgi:hypothetical protein